MSNSNEVIITNYGGGAAHVGIYQRGEQDGGSFIDVDDDGLVTLVLVSAGDTFKQYAININTLTVSNG